MPSPLIGLSTWEWRNEFTVEDNVHHSVGTTDHLMNCDRSHSCDPVVYNDHEKWIPLVRLSVTNRGTGRMLVRRKTDDRHSIPLSPMTLSTMKPQNQQRPDRSMYWRDGNPRRSVSARHAAPMLFMLLSLFMTPITTYGKELTAGGVHVWRDSRIPAACISSRRRWSTSLKREINGRCFTWKNDLRWLCLCVKEKQYSHLNGKNTTGKWNAVGIRIRIISTRCLLGSTHPA